MAVSELKRFDSFTIDELIDRLVWHNCAGPCSCWECIRTKEILDKKRNGDSHEDDSN